MRNNKVEDSTLKKENQNRPYLPRALKVLNSK